MGVLIQLSLRMYLDMNFCKKSGALLHPDMYASKLSSAQSDAGYIAWLYHAVYTQFFQ